MAKKVVWTSCTRLACACVTPAPTVVLCLTDAALLVPFECTGQEGTAYEYSTIEATLVKSWKMTNGCQQACWSYTFEYDENLLLDPTTALLAAQISGVFCKGCLTTWITEKIGNEVQVAVDEESENVTITSQHGCVTTFPIGGGGSGSGANGCSIFCGDVEYVFPSTPGAVNETLQIGGVAGNVVTLKWGSPDPDPGPGPDPDSDLSAFWVNNGEDKVTQNELRGSSTNSVWDGSEISIFGAKNEVVSFNLILESTVGVADVSVEFDLLTGPGGAEIKTTQTADVFDYVGRNIELFYVRYLQIKGLSLLSYEEYDERHVPIRMRRGWSGPGTPSGVWADRPDHDKYYPDIAVPMELHPTFAIAAGQNQSVWCDIFIPKGIAAGDYTGSVVVKETGVTTQTIPITLEVKNFTLPDLPSAKTMIYISYPNINARYIAGANYPVDLTEEAISIAVQQKHYQAAHRHKMSLIDDDDGFAIAPTDAPRPAWIPRLDGSLFTALEGYDGPGISTGNNVYSIGTYGKATWQTVQATMNSHSNNWINWFVANSISTEHFLFLVDEPPAPFTNVQTWSNWLNTNPGVGNLLRSFSTVPAIKSYTMAPALDIAATAAMSAIGVESNWNTAQAYYQMAGRNFYMYNGHRPQTGSFATEDDGIALRCLAWTHYKKNVDRWFYFEAIYYNDYQNGRGNTDVFNNAQIYGGTPSFDNIKGMTSAGYSNGDGLLFYPGTDMVFPLESYGIDGPIASLRLKHWRRGIQDVDYITLAKAINPSAVQTIVNNLIPDVLWEYGVPDPGDPTYVLTDISWSTDPDVWEAARLALANIIAP